VLHRGGTIAFLSGELTDDRRDVVAAATATARVVRL
jgi:acyl-coenzyme A thioesterase PaaI-like protein